MGEWKRVFLNKKRAVLTALIALVCLALFVASQMSGLSPEAFRDAAEAAKYGKILFKKWENMGIDELSAAVDAEKKRLTDYGIYVNGSSFIAPAFKSDEEAEETVSDMPYLILQSKNLYRFNRAYAEYMDCLRRISDEIAYLDGYPDYLLGISEQARMQSQVSLFRRSGSFSVRNLKKTADDFENADGSGVEFGNNLGIEKWLEFALADYFFLAISAITVLSFLEERRAGLWSAVRCCKSGRLVLGIHRTLILLAASALGAALIYLLPFAVSMAINGGISDLSRPLQSLESFKTCTLKITVFQWLIRYFVLKILSGFLVSLLLWCLLGTVSNPQFLFSVLGFILVAEYLLYEFLPVQSFMNILKYFNIFSYIHTSDLYTKYLNINLFGVPVGIRDLTVFSLPTLILILMSWALLIQTKRYPSGNKDYLSKLSDLKSRISDLFLTRLSIGGWEIWKLMSYEFGAVIVVVIIAATGSLAYEVNVPEPDGWYRMYLSDMEGIIDEKTDVYFEYAESSIPESDNSSKIKSALMRLKSETEDVKSRAKSGGFEPWLVNNRAYDSFYGGLSVERQRTNAAAAICLLILGCAGIFGYEKQSGVAALLRSQRLGRGALYRRKMLACTMMSAVVWAAVYLRELSEFIALHGTKTLAAPVQNIPALEKFPLMISLGQYLALLYMVRLAAIILTSFAVLAISQIPKNVLQAYVLNIGILGVPAVLILCGADVMKYFSPLIPISSAEILWSMGTGSSLPCLIWLIFAAAALTVHAAGFIKWRNG